MFCTDICIRGIYADICKYVCFLSLKELDASKLQYLMLLTAVMQVRRNRSIVGDDTNDFKSYLFALKL